MTATPGQPVALYANWFRVISADASDETVARSWELGGASDRKFWTQLDAERDQLREQVRLARAGREQVRAALAVSNADLGREREQVRLADQDRNQLRKAVLSLAAAWEDEGADGGVLRDCAGQLRHAAEPPS